MDDHLIPQPHDYEKRILLVVIGMTPQIVTETLYKLAVDSQPAYVPTEVHLITTREGANSARIALLGTENDKGWFTVFCEDYQLNDIQFNEHHMHIIADTEGQFIDDNESTEHNRIAANFITQKVKSFTERDDTTLHVSLAGGRKTMSYYAGYALSLYGRMQDRLSHVLVNAPFMNHKDFFYPRPKAERFEISNRYYSTDEARIVLADIPYVRMRYQVPQELLQGDEGFQETVEKIQQFNAPPRVVLDSSTNTILLNGFTVKLTNLEFAFYYWFCQRRLQDSKPLNVDKEDYFPAFLKVYRRFESNFGKRYEGIEQKAALSKVLPDDTPKTRKEKLDIRRKWFSDTKGKVRGKIHKALGESFAKNFLIETDEQEQQITYQLDIPKENIFIDRKEQR